MLACSASLKKQGNRVVSDKRKLWKNVGPLFSEKVFQKESVILNNSKTVNSIAELTEIFNEHFSKLVETLDTDKTLACNIASLHIPILFLMLLKRTNIIYV